jgi:hypothetical protein
METSLMSESVVDAADVEETVTRVLTHFVQGGGEQAEMSVELLQETGGVACGICCRNLEQVAQFSWWQNE